MRKPLFVLFFMALFSVTNSANTAPDSAQKYAEFPSCQLASGIELKPCKIGYRTFGKLNADATNTVLVPTWHTGNSQEHSYLASNKLIDPSQYFIVIVDSLSNGISTSPSNSLTQSGATFPTITIADMVDSQHLLLTEVLGVKVVYGIVGISMGGMQAFEWAVRYPQFASKIVATIGSPRLASFDIALWETRNRLFALYRQCQCNEALEALAGMWMLGQVPSELGKDVSPEKIANTIVTQAQNLPITVAQSWDQQRQAEAMITHNIARKFDNDMAKAAAQITAQMLIIVGEDDRVVTPQSATEIAGLLGAKLLELDEDCGHADPWCAPEVFANAVNSFLAQ